MRRYPDPNQEVERWKDAVYEETRRMSRQQLDRYFQTQMKEFAMPKKKRR